MTEESAAEKADKQIEIETLEDLDEVIDMLKDIQSRLKKVVNQDMGEQ